MKNTIFAVLITAAIVLFGCAQKVNVEAIQAAKGKAETAIADIEKNFATAQETFKKHSEAFKGIKVAKGDSTVAKLEAHQANVLKEYAQVVETAKGSVAKFDELLKEAAESKVSAVDAVKKTAEIAMADSTVGASAQKVWAEFEAVKKQGEEFVAKHAPKTPAKK